MVDAAAVCAEMLTGMDEDTLEYIVGAVAEVRLRSPCQCEP